MTIYNQFDDNLKNHGQIMKKEHLYELTSTFEVHAQTTENEVEFWLARDLQHLLGYVEWRNFTLSISKAKVGAFPCASEEKAAQPPVWFNALV